MRKADQWSGLAILIISIFICWGALKLPYGNLHEPGPGFFPLWIGIILGSMSIGLIFRVTRQKEGARLVKEFLAERMRWGKVLSVIIALSIYSVALEYVGYLFLTFLLMFFFLRFVDPQRWRTVIVWALVGALGSYFIFEMWLKLRLPKGFLGV